MPLPGMASWGYKLTKCIRVPDLKQVKPTLTQPPTKPNKSCTYFGSRF